MVLGERLTLENLDITDTDLYVKNGYPWEAWDLLRREAPVFWYERPRFEPFWAITKYEDIAWISSHPEVFSNAHRLRLADIDQVEAGDRGRERQARRYGTDPDDPPDMVFMDPPQHRAYRSLSSKFFTPKAMRQLETHFENLSEQYVANFARTLAERVSTGETVDLVRELAARLPVHAICEMADIPKDDWDKIFHWTEVLVGASDPEYQRPGETAEQTGRRNGREWRNYMEALIEEREAEGLKGQDLLSTLMRAEIDGDRLPPRELLSYITLLLAAGNETTRNSTTGGVVALLEHPDQLELLVANPELVPSAVEEILRWSSIVIQFARTCMEDTEIRGQKIRKGETIAMWYPSANRDEDIFDEPYKFDITRSPNDHFAFGGYGEHFCLGANLARWEMQSVFRELLPILPKLEMAGPPEMVAGSLHVGGIKHLPVRYKGS
jgi:cholest-4-en-3-one 26-monooxygenase